MSQAQLNFEATPDQEPGDIRENAEAWIQRNPSVMSSLERYALEMAALKRHFGMKLIVERARYQTAFQADGQWKLNNSYTAYVARELVRRHPHLANYLTFRRTKYEESA